MTWDGVEQRKPNGEHNLIAEAAVEKVLETYGVDVERPLEMQKDHAWTRQHRVSEERMGPFIKRTAIGVVATGVVTTTFMVIKEQFFK